MTPYNILDILLSFLFRMTLAVACCHSLNSALLSRNISVERPLVCFLENVLVQAFILMVQHRKLSYTSVVDYQNVITEDRSQSPSNHPLQ